MSIRERGAVGRLPALVSTVALAASTVDARIEPARAPSAPPAASANARPSLDLDLHRLEAAADRAADLFLEPGGPGFSVAVARDGEIVFQKSYGKADVELDVDATPASVYRIGSITKQFTAAAVLRLVEQGAMALDDPVAKHLPDFPAQEHAVTIRHLLNHTSGIPNYTRLEGISLHRDFRLDMTYPEMRDLVGPLPYDFVPGEDWSYNNSAYWLLGEIITRVSGTPYDRYIEQVLLHPAGLEHTLVADHREIVERRAGGYVIADDLTNAPFVSMHVPGGGGALSSTVGDLVRWAHLLASGAVVSAGSYRQMTTSTTLADGTTRPYGFGLHLEHRLGRRVVAHGGNISGFTSHLAYYPDSALSIAVLANVRPTVQADAVEAELARAAFGIEPLKDLPLAPEQLATYVGVYSIDRGGRTMELTVTIEDGRLRSQRPGSRGTLLRHQGDHVFIPAFDEDVRMTFVVSGDRADGLTIRVGEREMRGVRKE